MADESYSFTTARARLDEIVAQVRRKDVSLEQSLDLLEEGVRLANSCTELIDHTEWRSVVAEQEEGAEDPDEAGAMGEASRSADERLAEQETGDAAEVADADGTAAPETADEPPM